MGQVFFIFGLIGIIILTLIAIILVAISNSERLKLITGIMAFIISIIFIIIGLILGI